MKITFNNYKPKVVEAKAFQDAEKYLQDYKVLSINDPRRSSNVKFYRNEIVSRPQGAKIDEIHERWFGDYTKLETNHNYIQWLFPIREYGVNQDAQPLMIHEREIMRKDEEIKRRVIKSYELMLDFYGFALSSASTGKITRKSQYMERFKNLNTATHNYLRITRILKCLGELDLEYLQYGMVKGFLEQMFENSLLPNAVQSAGTYWTFVVKDQNRKLELMQYILSFSPYFYTPEFLEAHFPSLHQPVSSSFNSSTSTN